MKGEEYGSDIVLNALNDISEHIIQESRGGEEARTGLPRYPPQY